MDGIGERLKEERLRNGWSQKDLARESGTNVDTISGIETGQHEPRPSTLRKLAKALEIEVRELFEEPAPLGEAPDTGPSLLDKALDAMRRDEEKKSRAVNRLFASEGTLRNTNISDFEEDKFRAELRARGFPDEYFESFTWPLVVKAFQADQLEQELARLQEEREATQPSRVEAAYEEATEEYNERHYGPSLIAQGWDRLAERWTRKLEEGNFDQEELDNLVATLENLATGMEANVAEERKELVARHGPEAAHDMSLLRPSINRLGLLVGEILKETEKDGVSSETRDNLVNLAGHFQKEAS